MRKFTETEIRLLRPILTTIAHSIKTNRCPNGVSREYVRYVMLGRRETNTETTIQIISKLEKVVDALI